MKGATHTETRALNAKLRVLYEAGVDIPELAIFHGMDEAEVRYRLKRAGMTLPRHRPPEPERIGELRLLAKTMRDMDIAALWGISRERVRQLRVKHGISMFRPISPDRSLVARRARYLAEGKPCSTCKETKPVTAFGVKKSGWWESRCLACCARLASKRYHLGGGREKARQWRQENPDKQRANQKAYYQRKKAKQL